MDERTSQREQTIELQIGRKLQPLASPDELLGDWEMRFGGLLGSDAVQWTYRFRPDGIVQVDDQQWRWQFNSDGSLILLVSVPANPNLPGLENGATSEELRFPFRIHDGRIVLSNDDGSVIELLTRLAR